MDIALLSMILSQTQLQQQVNTSLLKQSLDVAEKQSETITQLMVDSSLQNLERVAQPHLGGQIDLRV